MLKTVYSTLNFLIVQLKRNASVIDFSFHLKPFGHHSIMRTTNVQDCLFHLELFGPASFNENVGEIRK